MKFLIFPLKFAARQVFFIKKSKPARLLTLLLLLPLFALSQPDSIKTRLNAPPPSFDPTIFFSDSNAVSVKDTTIRLSKDAIDAPIEYSADDSIHLEAKPQIVHLYGNATVKYQDFSLRAAYIRLDMLQKIVTAEGMPDSTGRLNGFPAFADKTQSFTAKQMRYNFETQKGIVYSITTQQQGGYIRGAKAKIIIAKPDSTETKRDEFYSSDVIFTTCDHEIPHFGIRSGKQKVIPDEEVIIGPSNLEIMGIPTPLWIPFGFFPLNVKQRSGLLFPRDYEFSPQFGFGLRGVGWYFGLGEHWDLQLTGDAYTRGTFAVNAVSRYRYRYKANGSLNVRYDSQRTGDPETPTFSINNSTVLTWTHNQDSKAHPTQTFSGSANLRFGNARRVFNDAQNVLDNQLRSNITYSKRWNDKPFRLSVSANHSQNIRTRVFNVTLPQLDFNVNQIRPFEKKISTGQPKWYEKIGFSYNLQATNSITATDTTIFTREALNDAKYGVRHALPINSTFTIFKYFQVSPSINYEEKWYFNTTRKVFDQTLIIAADTTFDSEDNIVEIQQDTTFGTVETVKINEFKALREFNAGISIGTQLFGTANNLKIGRLRALRHTVKPSLSYNYRPDYTRPFWGYFDEVQLDTRYPDELQRYTIFENGVYGAPSATGLTNAMSFNLSSLLEGKVQEKGDTLNTPKSWKKVQIIRNFGLSTSWNFAADSLNMSVVNMSGNTMLFKKIALAFSATFDPYAANTDDNTRINTFEWTKNNRPARFTNGGFTLTTSLTWKEIQDILSGKSTDEETKPTLADVPKGIAYVDNIRIGYDLRLSQRYLDGRDSLYLSTHSVSFSGTVNLTSQWRVTVGRIGYDFARKQLTYPDFQFYRSLHCWEMGTSWQPQRGTYSFFIRVRQSPLDFLQIPYGRGNYDIIPNF